jgi:hypothetical protein
VEGLLACQAEVARRVGGAGRSCWNGQVTGLPRPGDSPDLLGVADWDGTLRFSRREVLAPLRELLSGSPRRGQRALRRYKEALLAVFHENNHLLAPAGEEHDTALDGWDWAAVVMEEGVTEAYTSLHIGEFIRALRLDRLAPGLPEVEVPTAYPEYVPVVVALVERVARTSRLAPGEVLRELNAQTAPGKYRRLSQLSLAWLGEALPAEELRAWERGLERQLRDVLGRSRIFPLVRRGRIPDIAAMLADEAVRVLDQHLIGLAPSTADADVASPALP